MLTNVLLLELSGHVALEGADWDSSTYQHQGLGGT
jgi:hypothetical protein